MANIRNRHFFFIDLVLLPCMVVLAFALRLDAVGVQGHLAAVVLYIWISVPLKLLVFWRAGLYRRYWQYASLDELLLIAVATGVSVVLAAGLLFAVALPWSGIRGFPRSVPLIDGMLTLMAVGGPRFACRVVWQHRRRGRQRAKGAAAPERVLIVGAGNAGALIVKEMLDNPQVGLEPVGFVDDDPAKHGVRMLGLPVLCGRAGIPDLVLQYRVNQVIIAMPTAPGRAIREVLEICQQAGVPARIVPGMCDILAGQVSVSQARQVEIEDLLRREPVQIDAAAVERMLRGARVLVTGAGGSIGSELCRQIAACGPQAMVLVGHGENSIFDIANELRRRWPEVAICQAIADVRDEDRLAPLFRAHLPQIVFHAAAHKHVPLMEANPEEAATNNVLGTACLLRLCEAHGVDRFVLVSTDKVVRPSSVMGVTKRVAELLVQAAAHRSGRRYAAVRFGNVLGSRGSVVPFFRQQIAHGGPVTVTHPDVRRYFMTIPEAVQLVLQAAALEQGGEVFMLDMGEPVRIVDLAEDLIRLSGLRPHVRGEGPEGGVRGRDWDVEIVFTGLRPGEKLFEELCVDGEEYASTPHEKVFMLRNGHAAPPCPVDLERAVGELADLCRHGDGDRVRAKLREIVPNYDCGGASER